MSDKSKIEWTDATWNPVIGCSKVSAGCQNCYAEKMAMRLAAMGQHKYKYAADKNGWTGSTECCDLCLDIPLHWHKPRRIFVSSMGDLFHESVPFEFIYKVIAISMLCKHHIFQFLTKRPKRILECLTGLYLAKEDNAEAKMWDDARKWLQSVCKSELREYIGTMMAYPKPQPNIWFGVTVENPDYLWRIVKLLQIPAAVRFVSLEPLLGEIDLKWNLVYPSQRCSSHIRNEMPPKGLDWVIIGCESGPNRRECKIEWVQDIVQQCKAASVPVFVKQLSINGKVSKNPDEWPADLKLREYPRAI